MCSDRLAAGEAPACVQALPERGDRDPHRRRRARVAQTRRRALSCRARRSRTAITRADHALHDARARCRATCCPRTITAIAPAHAAPAAGRHAGADAARRSARSSSSCCSRCSGARARRGAARAIGARRARRSGSSALARASSTSAGRCTRVARVLGLRTSWLSREILAFGAVRGRGARVRRARLAAAALPISRRAAAAALAPWLGAAARRRSAASSAR